MSVLLQYVGDLFVYLYLVPWCACVFKCVCVIGWCLVLDLCSSVLLVVRRYFSFCTVSWSVLGGCVLGRLLCLC